MPFSLDAIGMDPGVMAANEFGPQYQLLDQMRKQQTGKYTEAGNTVGGMYEALSKAMRGNEGNIKRDYADSGKSIGKAYNDAINATSAGFSDSRNDIGDVAKRLGLDAGFGSAVSGGAEQQQRLMGLLAANSANQQGVNTLLGNNDVQYNRQEADTAGIAGVNARKDFKSQLMDALAGLDNKQLELKGAENEAANKYGLSIREMQQQSQLAREKMQADAAQQQGTDELAQARLMLDQSKYGLDVDKFRASQSQPGAAPKNQTPYEMLAGTARKLYGNDVAAGNAAKAITDTFTQRDGDHNWDNASDFISDVLRRNPQAIHSGGDYQQLQQLALQFYTQLMGGNAGKAYGGPLGG
jgi:hypothetical protein